MKAIAILLAISFSSPVLTDAVVLPLTDADAEISYPSIEYLSTSGSIQLPLTGNPELLPEETPQTEALRVVVYLSEIYHSVVIETITTGTEGCCSKVQSRQTFDLSEFAKSAGFTGEVSGFRFIEWSSSRSFRFTYQSVMFSAEVLSDGHIRIERA
ncbi:MAG: hypothetical protein NVV60_11890 [Luteimonas sp.]|nr:hypothetical protein [Luteimonas sp.]MCR6663812.1 hypothetical protein [Luteimonas sp.]